MSNRPTIVFHYPNEIDDSPKSGSALRPLRMLEAFSAIGCDVIPVIGHSARRGAAIEELLAEIDAGRTIDGVYSECVTTPTALSDPNHLPTHPFLDPIFFRKLRSHDIPIGLFYRDVYWRFPIYDESLPLSRRVVAKTFYHFDLEWYRRFVDVVFLPSLEMAEVIPGRSRFQRLVALPPGSDGAHAGTSAATQTPARPANSPLRLLYVGGVLAPLYDITPLLDAVERSPNVELRLCCPASHREAAESHTLFKTGRLDIIHAGSSELAEHYAWADSATVFFSPHEYRDFAMPIKLFEAIGAGLPVIASTGTSVARFVDDESVGWTATGVDELAELLSNLSGDGLQTVRNVSNRVLSVCHEHTWSARASTVLSELGVAGSTGQVV